MTLELDGSEPLHGRATSALKSAFSTAGVHAGMRLPATCLPGGARMEAFA